MVGKKIEAWNNNSTLRETHQDSSVFSFNEAQHTYFKFVCERERPSIFGIGLTEIEVFILKSCKPQDDGMTTTVTATARRSRRRRRLRKPKDDGSVYWKAIAKAQKRETIKRRT